MNGFGKIQAIGLGCHDLRMDAPVFPDCDWRLAKFDGTPRGCYDRTAGWSSLVARWAHNPKVGGSNPPPATKPLRDSHLQVSRILKVAS
jgi:hypothetical protein